MPNTYAPNNPAPLTTVLQGEKGKKDWGAWFMGKVIRDSAAIGAGYENDLKSGQYRKARVWDLGFRIWDFNFPHLASKFLRRSSIGGQGFGFGD